MAEDTPARNMIIENPAGHAGFVWKTDKKDYPKSPKVITGKSKTVGAHRALPDVEKAMKELSAANDAFMIGASQGYLSAEKVFGNESSVFEGLANAYWDAEKNIFDGTPVGRSQWLVRREAMLKMQDFNDPAYDNLPMAPRFYKRKEAFFAKVYAKWVANIPRGSEKPSRQDFDKLTRQLISVRKVIAGEAQPVLPVEIFPNAQSAESYQNGFRRAFEILAEPYKDQLGLDQKYWYLGRIY